MTVRTYDVCLRVPTDVAEADGLVPNADGDCLCWWLLDADDDCHAVELARQTAAEEIGGHPGQYSVVVARVIPGFGETNR